MADDEQTDQGASSESTSQGEPRFTQTDVERIVNERLRRARIDIEEIAQLRSRAEDSERLQARVQTLEREREGLRHDLSQMTERAERATLRSEVMSEATRAGAVDPEDVFRLLPEGAVKLEDGKAVGAEAAVKALAERKAHLFAPQGPRRPTGGDGGARDDGGQSPARQSDMSRLMRRAAGMQQ